MNQHADRLSVEDNILAVIGGSGHDDRTRFATKTRDRRKTIVVVVGSNYILILTLRQQQQQQQQQQQNIYYRLIETYITV